MCNTMQSDVMHCIRFLRYFVLDWVRADEAGRRREEGAGEREGERQRRGRGDVRECF